jgi:ATP-dependent Clp protease ATP-binding subunit ClpA
VYLLNKQDIQRLDVVNYLSHGLSSNDKAAEEKVGAASAVEQEAVESPLDKYTTNLNQEALAGKI